MWVKSWIKSCTWGIIFEGDDHWALSLATTLPNLLVTSIEVTKLLAAWRQCMRCFLKNITTNICLMACDSANGRSAVWEAFLPRRGCHVVCLQRGGCFGKLLAPNDHPAHARTMTRFSSGGVFGTCNKSPPPVRSRNEGDNCDTKVVKVDYRIINHNMNQNPNRYRPVLVCNHHQLHTVNQTSITSCH